MMTTEERLERVEHRNRWMMAFVSVVSVGWLASRITSCSPGFAATETNVIRAERFEIVDHAGRVRGVLGVVKGGPVLELLDDNGNPSARLGVVKDRPVLALGGGTA